MHVPAEVDAVVNANLGVDVFHMGMNSETADAVIVGHFIIRHSADDAVKYFHFPFTEVKFFHERISDCIDITGKHFAAQPPHTAALAQMINPGSQPTIKEAVRLGMGTDLDYKITFGFAPPSHLAVFAPAMGATGNGVVVAGSYPPWTHTHVDGIKFALDLQEKYRPNNKVSHIMYLHGIIEAMIQTEALRLALKTTSADKITSAIVLKNGFEKITELKTGDLTPPITFGPGKVEGVNLIRLDEARDGEAVLIGYYSTKGVYAK